MGYILIPSYPHTHITDSSDCDSNGSESESVGDTAPVEIAVNFEFSVQDIADALLNLTNTFMSFLHDFI